MNGSMHASFAFIRLDIILNQMQLIVLRYLLWLVHLGLQYLKPTSLQVRYARMNTTKKRSNWQMPGKGTIISFTSISNMFGLVDLQAATFLMFLPDGRMADYLMNPLSSRSPHISVSIWWSFDHWHVHLNVPCDTFLKLPTNFSNIFRIVVEM